VEGDTSLCQYAIQAACLVKVLWLRDFLVDMVFVLVCKFTFMVFFLFVCFVTMMCLIQIQIWPPSSSPSNENSHYANSKM